MLDLPKAIFPLLNVLIPTLWILGIVWIIIDLIVSKPKGVRDYAIVWILACAISGPFAIICYWGVRNPRNLGHVLGITIAFTVAMNLLCTGGNTLVMMKRSRLIAEKNESTARLKLGTSVDECISRLGQPDNQKKQYSNDYQKDLLLFQYYRRLDDGMLVFAFESDTLIDRQYFERIRFNFDKFIYRPTVSK
jgi:hypothetical protein